VSERTRFGGVWGTCVRETEKPKVSGWSAKRRLRMVDLPEPEGPEMMGGFGGLLGFSLV
jgi:hypothetical protein